MKTILSIGHSTLEYQNFVALLKKSNVTAIADVRSSPYSRYFPQYVRENLKELLKRDGISYVFLGEELGGRPKENKYFSDGIADYEKMAKSSLFKSGIDRVESGSENHCICLMCSEHNPLDCHRCLLVGRALSEKNFKINHIMSNGEALSQIDIENKILDLSNTHENDMFISDKDRLEMAYRSISNKIAYSTKKTHSKMVAQ